MKRIFLGWVPGGLVAIAVLGCGQLKLWQPLEQLAYNVLFQVRGERSWDERVVVVTIDEPSVKQLGAFPWSRQRYAKFLDIMAKSGSAVVAMDILFTESKPEDHGFASAIARHSKVVLAQAWDDQGNPLLTVPLLEQAAIEQGHILTRQDSDGIPRRIDPQIQGVPALSVMTTQVYGLSQPLTSLPPLDCPLELNWLGNTQQAPQYSFSDVVNYKIPAERFKDKIVLLGVALTGADPLITPFNRNPPANGIFLHATAVNNLLQENALRTSNDRALLLLLLIAPLLSFCLSRLSLKQQRSLLLSLGVSWIGICLIAIHWNY
jgi:CHASE2 domain-containing sensor protein